MATPPTPGFTSLLPSYARFAPFLNVSYPDHLTLWAALLLAFFAFLCSGKFLSLHLSDLHRTADGYQVHIKQSKTDPFRSGAVVTVFPCGDLSLYAVTALNSYLVTHGPIEHTLFLSSSRSWHPRLEYPSPEPLEQSGTQTVTWNETHSLLVSRVAPRLSPGTRRIFAAPSSASTRHLAGLRHSLHSQLCHSAWHLEPGRTKTPCPAPPSSMAPGRLQSCPLHVGFGQTIRISLPHMDFYHANDCFN